MPILFQPLPSSQRSRAYTTPRPDVFAMVPSDANLVLDVGCSNGALGSSLKAARTGRRVYGIEFDAQFAAEASQSLDFVVHADLNELDWDTCFDRRNFDCIIFADVLEHIVEPGKCLVQARRHLEPGGRVVISVPNVRHLSAFFAIFLGGRFPQRDRGIFDRTHLRWFTVTDAKRLLVESGFRITCISVTLRWGDRGGGRMNRLLNRLPPRLQSWGPIREFLAYQVCLQGELA